MKAAKSARNAALVPACLGDLPNFQEPEKGDTLADAEAALSPLLSAGYMSFARCR